MGRARSCAWEFHWKMARRERESGIGLPLEKGWDEIRRQGGGLARNPFLRFYIHSLTPFIIVLLHNAYL